MASHRHAPARLGLLRRCAAMTAVPLLLVGASGHCRSLLTVIRRQAVYEPVGLIDSLQPVGSKVLGLPVLGREADALAITESHGISHLFIAVGDNFQRQRLSRLFSELVPACRFAVLIDPSAVVAADATLASGVAVMAHSYVGPGTRIDEGALINTAASIDHDSSLGAFASLAPGVITGGRVAVGARSAIGLGAHIIHGISIGADTVVGAGSLVLSELPEGIVAYGSPAMIVRTRTSDEPYL
jgi:sugar O-acyltransferase (sialic acid O-acetyltransferase NeuD family)